MKKILLFDTWITSPQVETSLEIAENHVEAGDEVYLVNISQAFQIMEWELETTAALRYRYKCKKEYIKRICKSKNIKFSDKLLVKPIRSFSLPTEIKDINDLKKYKYEDVDFGMALASTLISRSKNNYVSVKENYKAIDLLGSSAITALNSFKKWLVAVKPDLVYIRNARSVFNRPLYRYAKLKNINIKIHERAGHEGVLNYSINDTLIHDREYWNKQALQQWEGGLHDSSEKIEIAKTFFNKRFKGKNSGLIFTQQMEQGLLPDGYDHTKHNIVFFTGSMTEYAAIDDNNKADTIFESQFDAVENIASWVSQDNNIRFYLRLHPNTKKKYQNEYIKWTRLREKMGDKIIWIDGDAPIDSYSLARACNKVIVHMSTMGIESVILNTASIIVGNPVYKSLGSNYVPKDQEACRLLVLNKELQPLDKIGAYKYGYFHMTWGIPFKRFVPYPNHRFLGEYEGVNFEEAYKLQISTQVIFQFLNLPNRLKVYSNRIKSKFTSIIG